MKFDRKRVQARAAAKTRGLCTEERDMAFRREREAEREANAEKTAHLRELRLSKASAAPTEPHDTPGAPKCAEPDGAVRR